MTLGDEDVLDDKPGRGAEWKFIEVKCVSAEGITALQVVGFMVPQYPQIAATRVQFRNGVVGFRCSHVPSGRALSCTEAPTLEQCLDLGHAFGVLATRHGYQLDALHLVPSDMQHGFVEAVYEPMLLRRHELGYPPAQAGGTPV